MILNMRNPKYNFNRSWQDKSRLEMTCWCNCIWYIFKQFSHEVVWLNTDWNVRYHLYIRPANSFAQWLQKKTQQLQQYHKHRLTEFINALCVKWLGLGGDGDDWHSIAWDGLTQSLTVVVDRPGVAVHVPHLKVNLRANTECLMTLKFWYS